MRKKQPVVSVIVPIYRMEDYLQQCIDSICRQTYYQLEIILVDDGSPDNCGVICDNISKTDSRVIVIHKENGGLSSARNAGLDIAKGKYISFVDADDMVHPQFIEILVSLCEQYDCDIAQCDFLRVAEHSLNLPLNMQQSISLETNRKALYKFCCTNDAAKYVAPWNKVYKRELFDDIRYPSGRLHEDEFVAHLLLWKASKIAVTNQYLYYYLQRTTSIMGKPFSIKRLDALDAFKERLEFLKANNLKREYISTLNRLISLIQQDYVMAKEDMDDSTDVCMFLRKEEEFFISHLNSLILSENQMSEKLIYSKESRIVLYGAGHWGRIYYQWIEDNQYGEIVGWVDNNWKKLKKINSMIAPITSILNIPFDYVLITIKDGLAQREVAENLVSWGVPQSKILMI